MLINRTTSNLYYQVAPSNIAHQMQCSLQLSTGLLLLGECAIIVVEKLWLLELVTGLHRNEIDPSL